MSDLNALAEKLAALASSTLVFDAGARVISEGGEPAPLAAILNEIDDTVLERKLEIEGGKSTINLIAAGRRLRGIYSVGSASSANVVGQILSREEPDMVQAAYDMLHDLCGASERLTVRALTPDPFGSGGERGISARGLAELWQVEMNEAPRPPMERFLSKNAAAFSSILHVRKGEIVAKSGDIEALQTIWKTQMESFRKAHKDTLKGAESAQLICLDSAFEDGTSAAVALFEGEIALIAYQSEKFGGLQSSWQRIFA